MRQRNVLLQGGKRYRLVARGEASNLERALDLVQRMMTRADVPVIGGIVEVADCTVTIELLD